MSPAATHRTLPLGDITMHFVEQGRGPLVLLCHGWPECWYSWRHQLDALAAAGFRAVAPDLRGFGETDAPGDLHAYTILHSVGDMVRLVAALGERDAVIIGHDWGGAVAWTAALLRPDLFRAVVGISEPLRERGRVPPLQAQRDLGVTASYWHYFQAHGVAEAELERDVDRTVRSLFAGRVAWTISPGKGFLQDGDDRAQLPAWFTERDVAFYVDALKRSGFQGGLNWYRNADRNWELSAAWAGLNVRVPALFVAGTGDPLMKWLNRRRLAQMQAALPGLKATLLLEGAGHLVHQERAGEVNAALIDFLRSA